MKQIKTISIKCETEHTLKIEEMTEFQGGLKERTDIDYDKIKLSIIKFGFSFPFFVWKHDGKNLLLDGHGRFATLIKMRNDGYIIPSLPVVYIDCKDVEDAKQKLLRLNSTYGKMTQESVLEFLGNDIEIEDIEKEIILPSGVIDFSDVAEDEETQGDDETPEVDEDEEPDSQLGEMYELGNSILMCGSATSEEDINRLLDGEQVQLVLTDPPYGISVVSSSKKVGGDKAFGKGTVGGKIVKSNSYAPIIGDDSTDTARDNYNIIKDCSDNQIIFGGNYFTDFLYPSKCWLVWDKENTGNFADVELAWTSFDKGAKLYKWLWNGLCRKGSRKEEGQKRVHPTQKPVGMLAEILKDFSEEEDLILDCFGGSGSTLIACESISRRCRMIELSPHYCDVIRKRYTKWAKENNRPITSGCLE